MSQMHVLRTRGLRPRTKPPHRSPFTHHTLGPQSSNKKSRVITRCNSEPTWSYTSQYMTPPGETCMLFRSRVSTNIISSSSPELMPKSYENIEGYNKDAKVVIKVTVEGSVGPIRALVKLGSSIEDTIKLVMNKYNEERRSPRLDQDDITSFELHHSCFSLQCFDKSDMIGEIGSRNFYMRKSVNSDGDGCSNTSIGSGIIVAKADEAPYSKILSSFIHDGLRKWIRRMSKIRRFLGCFGGDFEAMP